MALKLFFIIYATECEMALCLCKLCRNARLLFILSCLKKGNWVVRFLSLTEFFTAKCDQTVLSSNGFTTVHVSQENANNAVKSNTSFHKAVAKLIDLKWHTGIKYTMILNFGLKFWILLVISDLYIMWTTLKTSLNKLNLSHMLKIQVGWINTMANKIRATKASHLLLCKYTNAKVNKKQKSINSTSPLPSEENWKYLCIVNVQTIFFGNQM